jgi:autotransporter-associated beta strand protein
MGINESVTFDSYGRIYSVSRNNQLFVFNPDDTFFSTPIYSLPAFITIGVAVDFYNHVYVAGTVHAFSSIDSGLTPYGGAYGSGGNYQLKFDPYNNLLYFGTGLNYLSIFQSNNGTPNLLNQANIPSSLYMNSGNAFDAVYNPTNSLLYVSNNSFVGIQLYNPATSYGYVSTYGNTWGLGITCIDVEPVSGYLYVTDLQNRNMHTFSSNGSNHAVISMPFNSDGLRINNKTGKIYGGGNTYSSVVVYFDPFAWTSPGTSYLMSLPLNQNLALNAGYNLTMSSGTIPGVSGSIIGLGASPTAGMGVLSLNAGSTLTLAGGILTPDINQGIVMNTGTLVDQFNSTLNFPMTVNAPSTITSNGGNTLKLAGTTTINNTTLTLNGAGTTKITGNITGTGTLNVNGNINFANTVMFGGSINLSSGTPSLTANQIWGSLQGSAPLTMNNYMITLGADNTNQTYSGSLTGTGVIYKNGTGIQTFNGNLSGFTGMIVVSHGEVIINSSTPFGGKIINNSTINTKNNTVINGDFTTSGTFIVG